MKTRFFLLFIGFALFFAALTIASVMHKSPTYDETIHLFAGYSYLKWGDFRINPEHPPLVKVLAALPLLALDLKDPIPLSPYWDLTLEQFSHGWVLARQMVFLENDAEELFFYARLPMIALAILLGTFVCLWAQELYGFNAGLVALLFYALDPNILAYGPLVHTDIPFAAFFFFATYFLWRAFTRLTWLNLSMVSVFFGLSAITKYSFFTILPIWGALGMVRIFSREPLECALRSRRRISGRLEKTALLVLVLLCAALAAYLAIWAAYGFRFKATAGDAPLLNFAPLWSQAGLFHTWVSSAIHARLFPEAPVYGLLYVLQSLRRPAYLLGQVSSDGFWLYFPVVFAVKTPLATLLLLGVVALLFFKRRPREGELFLVIPIIAYFSFAVFSRLNIGLRHLLPIYPFLFVLAGGAAAKLWSGAVFRRCALIVLLLWQLWSSWSVYPDYLAYFNELAGGPKNGYKILTDSSLDWGQDLKGLKRWMDEKGVKRIQLGYFGTADPKYYGIDAVYLPGSIIFPSRPEPKPQELSGPEYLAVSATYLYGVHSGTPLGGFYIPLRAKRPVVTIGHSIFVFKLG